VLDQAVSDVLKLSREWGVPVPGEAAERIVRFLLQLLRWNERVNLTGARDLAELLGEHLPDSFALAKLSPERAEVVDVGAGGGLPGIPFALIRPDCQVTLVEPRAKRIAFLNAAVRDRDCRSVKVLRARMEDLADSGYDLAASRAAFAPDEWLSRAGRILCTGGLAVVFATAPVAHTPGSIGPVREISYATASGSPRWAATFCFT
jgi:16S rRNA (guanine527-N7)-methyltransferase